MSTSKSSSTPLFKGLLAAGLNAHGQLDEREESPAEIRAFAEFPCCRQKPGSPERELRLVFTSWSSTLIAADACLRGIGSQHSVDDLDCSYICGLSNAFGDHNGMKGCLYLRKVLLFDYDEKREKWSLSELNPVREDCAGVELLAMAENGKVAITLRQQPGNARLGCDLRLFDTLDAFFDWYRGAPGSDAQAHEFSSEARQLIAGTATFTLLLENGSVWTWGDARYQSLGRSVVGEDGDVVPASKPGILEALDGLFISKVACGGWSNAAISSDDALYVWGTGTPGTDRTPCFLGEAGAGEVALVDLDGQGQLDAVDVAVGDNHIAALTAGGDLFVVGDNQNGQLGLDDSRPFFPEWQCVPRPSGRAIKAVFCGPKATFLLTG